MSLKWDLWGMEQRWTKNWSGEDSPPSEIEAQSSKGSSASSFFFPNDAVKKKRVPISDVMTQRSVLLRHQHGLSKLRTVTCTARNRASRWKRTCRERSSYFQLKVFSTFAVVRATGNRRSSYWNYTWWPSPISASHALANWASHRIPSLIFLLTRPHFKNDNFDELWLGIQRAPQWTQKSCTYWPHKIKIDTKNKGTTMWILWLFSRPLWSHFF